GNRAWGRSQFGTKISAMSRLTHVAGTHLGVECSITDAAPIPPCWGEKARLVDGGTPARARSMDGPGRSPGWSSPTLPLLANCCGRAVSGHAPTALPSSVMNSIERAALLEGQALRSLEVGHQFELHGHL